MADIKWCDDRELWNEIQAALIQTLPQAARPGPRWIEEQIEDAPDQDWGNKEVRQLNIEDLLKQAKVWAKGQGLLKERSTSVPKVLASASVGRMYATLENVRELVIAARLKFWATEEPPFAKTREGHKEAVRWFTETEAGDRQKADNIPADVKVTFIFQASNSDRKTQDLISAPLLDHSQENEEGRLIAGPDAHEAVLANLSEMTSSGEVLTIKHVTIGHLSMPKVKVPSPKGGSDSFNAFEGSTLGELLSNVQKVVERAGWWTEQEALGHILFGLNPLHNVDWASHHSFSEDVRITLTIDGPATEEEVIDKYREALEYLELAPLSLTEQHRGLLELVHKTPDTPWPRRFEVWSKWCERHKGVLKPYSNWRGLRSSYESARIRATRGWDGREKGRAKRS